MIPKASAKATVFDAPQQVKGMNSILAMLIVLVATGITAAIVIPEGFIWFVNTGVIQKTGFSRFSKQKIKYLAISQFFRNALRI